MTSLPARRLLAVVSIAAFFGAGCPTKPPSTTPPTPGPSAGKIQPTSMGFGKLPKPAASSQPASPSEMAIGTNGAPAMAQTAPSVSADMMMAAPSAGGSVGKTMPARPIPPPYPKTKPVTVQYNIEGTLPTWGATGDVLQLTRTLPDPEVASAFAQNAGLPSASLNSKATITSVSLQWKDTDSYQWSFDAGNHMASFWKNTPYLPPETDTKKQPSTDKTEMLKIADAFLNAHGFASIAAGGGTIEDQPWMMGGVQKSDAMMYPCPMMEGSGGGVSVQAVPPDAPVMKPMAASAGTATAVPTIMPYPPCGWWPQQVTVFYGGSRDGKPVVDSGGYPYRSTSVTVDIQSKQVTSGNMQLDQNVERSSYPLIDQETAKKRLQSGGLNPVWPWGNEPGNINVHLAKFDIVWMRYDVWTDNNSGTYFIPALRGTGTVERGIKGQTPEPYSAIVPLPADDVFDDQGPTPSPYPVPMPAVQGGMRVMDAPTPPPNGSGVPINY